MCCFLLCDWSCILHVCCLRLLLACSYLDPKVCRIIAFYRYWAIILPTLGGFGRVMVLRVGTFRRAGFGRVLGSTAWQLVAI